MNKKTIITISIILGLTVIVGGFLILQKTRNQGMVNNQNNNKQIRRKPELTDQDRAKMKAEIDELHKNPIDTSNWKEYCNQEYGFCLKYPENWMYTERYNKNGIFGFVVYECKKEDNRSDEECSYVRISAYSDIDKNKKSGFWEVDEFEYGGKIPAVLFSEKSLNDNVISYRDNLFGYTRDIYKIAKDNFGYKLIIKYKNPTYNPTIERTILESFRFMNKEK